MTVAIVRATLDTVDAAMSQLLDLVGYHPQRPLFVKPNLPDGGPPNQGLYTDPAVVAAFLGCFPGREAVIGEGSTVGCDAGTALQRNGYRPLASGTVRLVDLDNVEREPFTWRYGHLDLPTLLRSHEYVNIAKMKTHIQTGVSLGLKNQKGLLTQADKRRFHRVGLDDHIRALGEAVQPALTIVDGIVALEGDGPWRYGIPVPMNLLVGGTNIVEVDNVCLRLMGFPAEHAPHIPNQPVVNVVGMSLAEARRTFAFSYRGYFRFRNAYEHIHDSCSGCNWAVYRAFRAAKRDWRYRLKLQYRVVWRRLDIVMGHASELPQGHGRVVCVGDCSRQFAQRWRLPLAKGCPPEASDVLRVL